MPLEPVATRAALQQALAAPADERRAAVAAVVAAHPRSLFGWFALGDLVNTDPAAVRLPAYEEVLRQPYMLTHRVYGLPAREVMFRYALKNALL